MSDRPLEPPISPPATGPSCAPDAPGRCITCSDEAIEAQVLRVDAATDMALVCVDDTMIEVDISLVDALTPGDRVLLHGGVAIGRL